MSLRREKILVAVVLQVAIAALIWGTGQPGRAVNPPPEWLLTRLDGRIALHPAAVWIYLSWYPAPLLLLLGDRLEFRCTYAAVGMAFAACAVAFVAFPYAIERPSLDGLPGLSVGVLRILYRLDPACNVFPSFHAALAAVIVCSDAFPLLRRWIRVLWAAAVCVSCLLVGQHYVADVLVGVGVGLAAYQAAEMALRDRTRVENESFFRLHVTTTAPAQLGGR